MNKLPSYLGGLFQGLTDLSLLQSMATANLKKS